MNWTVAGHVGGALLVFFGGLYLGYLLLDWIERKVGLAASMVVAAAGIIALCALAAGAATA